MGMLTSRQSKQKIYVSMAVHAGMLRAIPTGALLTFVGKKLETF